MTTTLDVTHGTLLDGCIQYAQHRQGYRTGIEPVLLAASIPARPSDRVLEAGCGAAAALLCLLWRIPGLVATGIEIDPETAALARANLQSNHHSATIETSDVTRIPLPTFDHVFANPPWHAPAATNPPHARRALATHGDALSSWITALAVAVAPGGTLTLVIPAAQAPAAAALLDAAGLGQAVLLPLAPKLGRPAKLSLLQARHGPTRVTHHTPLILHTPEGPYTPEVQAILRTGAPLPIP